MNRHLGRSEGFIDTIFVRRAEIREKRELICLAFQSSDSIRLIELSPNSSKKHSIVELLKETLETHWKKGLQNFSIQYECPCFKLKGNPWFSGSIDETLAGRLLICDIIRFFQKNDWDLYSTIASNMGSECELASLYFIKI